MENIKTVSTTLILNEEEATWLKNIMQNPLWVDDPSKEEPNDKRLRHIFWDALGGNSKI